ncbi:helix-turn-helix domain-containing protein [Catenulispora subtropica]|uniref:HTH arsR-type domain-containing protein n=1 Tax=Catenulispora subtropica TaxID=450798 RepID=A0ABN2QS84_9ACTN
MQVTYRFGVSDLTSIGFTVSPMLHLLVGSRYPDAATSPLAARRWWRSVRGHVPAAAQPFLALANSSPWYVPEALAPPVALPEHRRPVSIDEELDMMRAYDDSRLELELETYAELGPIPRAVQALSEDDRAITRLADSAHALFKACMAADWPDMQRRLHDDVARRRAMLGSVGLGETLLGIHPGWRDPAALTLTLPCEPGETDCLLNGRGFLLAPTLFLSGKVVPVVGPRQKSLFGYTAATGAPVRPAAEDALVGLLGRGRAAALRHIAEGCTTGDLAFRMRVSAPTASVHAATLREAGLITTVRDGRRVLHATTSLGAALLDANPEPR